MKKIAFLIVLFSGIANAQSIVSADMSVTSTIENSCVITAQSGSLGAIDFFSPANRYNTHDHIRDVYATTPISIRCTPGTSFNFKGTPQNTKNGNGYMLQHTTSASNFIVVNPYFDLSPKNSEPDFSKLFRGQNNRYVTASGNLEDWTMYWFAFNYLSGRFSEVPHPIAGEYMLNMTLNLDY